MRVNFLLFFAKKRASGALLRLDGGEGRGQHLPTFKMIDLSQHQNGLVDHEYTTWFMRIHLPFQDTVQYKIDSLSKAFQRHHQKVFKIVTRRGNSSQSFPSLCYHCLDDLLGLSLRVGGNLSSQWDMTVLRTFGSWSYIWISWTILLFHVDAFSFG